MKKLMMWLMLVCYGVDGNAAGWSSLMELPPFERAVLIIKYYESLHRPEHWPTIGFGHIVQPGEPYKKGVQLPERQADALLRKDLRKFCALYRSYGRDSLLLACLAYNVGSGRLHKSTLLKKLRSGNRDIYHEYTSFSRYKGKRHSGLYRRRWIELGLFFQP